MYETSDIRKGLKIEIDGTPFIVVDFQFVKPGKGVAFTRTRLKNMETGAVIERTFRTGEKLDGADVEERTCEFLYKEGDSYHFMDTDSYEQFMVEEAAVGEARLWLTENLQTHVLLHRGRAISVELPNFVELEVVEADPGLRGDTASGATKPVTLQTGARIQVPLFITVGEVLRIDTRTGSYVERVKR
ncbi:MAG: elongation factor P [Deltaproteobacteria bacterium]|nr:elongation factor P [Deltaproteobacteria bacterium]